MANINSFIHNTGLNEKNSFPHLLDAIGPSVENESDLIEQSKYYDDHEFKSVLQKLNSKISILSLNCQSINAKFDKIKIFLDGINDMNSLSIICIQETWSQDDIDMTVFNLPNYTMLCANRRISAHGGLIIYVHDDFAFKELNATLPITHTSMLFESLIIEVRRKSYEFQKYTIGNIYRLPLYTSDDLTKFTDKHTQLLHELRLRSKTVYLCGDYNIDLLKIDSNEKFSTFYENTTSVGFVPKITLPTRICETTSTLIDNIYTNVIDKSHTSGILITPISDHQMYFCTMNENFDRSKNAQKYVEVEFCNQENMDKFKNEVANADLYNKLDLNINTDPNYNYEIFSKHLQAAKSKHIPKKIKKFNKRKHKKEKWMTNELLIKIVEKNNLYVKWKTTPINLEKYEEIKKQFKECEKNVIKLIKEAKQQYFDRIFTAYKTDLKKTWRTISETLCRNKKHCDVPSRFFHDGKELSEPKAIANAFNVYFANIGKNLAATIEQDNNADFNHMQYLGTPTKTSFNFHCITEIETMKAIDTLENKSSSGHDGISNKIVKLLKNEISKPLTVIINQMLKTGIFPDSFKTSKIVSLFKKGDHGLLTNYRPISLLPTISKLFERVIYDQMYLYFNNNNLLADEQFGFRKNHSTEYAAIKLVDHISNEMESGKTPVTLFIDLSKAFDTLSFDILLQKLNYYGIAGVNLKLMANYLRNRKQYVVFNNHNSEITDIKCGVPQGSILGPLFFSICINDLKNASNKCKFLMYADDTTIYFNIEDFNTNNLEAEINKELEQVNTWLKVNKLSLNVGKTKMMIFHRKRKHIPELKVLIDGCNIECVNSFNFLGIMLDQGLSWNNHVDLV